MRQFRALLPHAVEFGPGKAREAGDSVKDKAVLFMSDQGVKNAGVAAGILAALKERAKSVYEFWNVPPEPTEGQVTDVVAEAAKAGKVDAVIAVGGGSVMDMAKFVSVMLDGGPSMDDLFAGKLPQGRKCALIMIPTTAGTGSEATPNSIALRPALNLKVGVVCAAFIPDQVILDPELLAGLPPAITAATGLDALCHALECYVSSKANPMSDMFALEAMRLIFKSLLKAFRDGRDLEARGDTLLAAFYGGVCIASSGTTAVHALSYPLGGRYRIPHGVSNAILLAPVFACNKDSCLDKLARVADIAADCAGESLAGQSREQKADYLIALLARLSRELGIPEYLEDLGVQAKDLDLLVDSAFEVKRLLNNNPKSLAKEDIRGIYVSIFRELA